MNAPLVLKTALGAHDSVKPIKDGTTRSERLHFDFVEFNPLPKGFRSMVRNLDLDLSEMALTTHAMAHAAGVPIMALPIPVWGRLHHANLVCAAEAPIRDPRDLEGKSIGVRAYSQTTGVWLRGILQTEYGVDLSKITWVTMEDAHVAGYVDPANCVRETAGRSLRDLLFTGEVAAIMGERNVDPASIRPVIPDADTAAKQWSEATGIFPVNHVVAVRTELLEQYDWLGRELFDLFEASKQESGAAGAALPYGLEPNRASMQMLIDFAFDQGLVPRAYPVDELFWKL